MTRPTAMMSVLLLGLLTFTTIWTTRPKSADKFLEVGESCLMRRDYDSAIAAFDQAIQLDPRLARAYGCRAEAYEEAGEYDKAIADCTKAIQLEPNDAEAYICRGHALEGKRDLRAALKEYLAGRRIELSAHR